MQRQRGELVPIGEVVADLSGPVQALRKTSPPARRGFTQADQVKRMCCNFQKEAGERWVGSTGRRLMQPPRTVC